MDQPSRSLSRAAVLQALREHRAHLEREFGVRGLALFGSLARDEAGEQSDVDILVGYDGPASAQQYFGVQFYLEDLLGHPVDLISEKALRAELRPYVEREAIRV
ncbi:MULTISPECIES: nucleotidyltransferase family protein [unclassified Thioalkalivibrio]|uniref:nucleotidyltransferase family protein n=1 Tax=unclassified Thioalkalivibrio TaxID=2621013 RepID=UPI000477D18A|nr:MULTISPECIES: nucleotidyltransferase family protein [unclassified Thioalkalivibrio]